MILRYTVWPVDEAQTKFACLTRKDGDKNPEIVVEIADWLIEERKTPSELDAIWSRIHHDVNREAQRRYGPKPTRTPQ